ncbi:hypothetical protein [Catenuloplanes atrovinosus]|uniref:Uncharacterized protein YukE n=1 Tax=Catenuloplanes atrovinosus TaxID=137266 RepID=A0AAE3YPV0_9ACTN|nr:hypothetical protein [Catenuloplanes atrovinosus]MDR7275601.1 uncharacterized protein YukE [Catenuloplanes atrovinosus]
MAADDVKRILSTCDEELARVRRMVTGDVGTLTRMATAYAACGAHAESAARELIDARTRLAAAWAAPTGEDFQRDTAPLPGGCTAADTLCGQLSNGLHDTVRQLWRAERAVVEQIAAFRFDASRLTAMARNSTDSAAVVRRAQEVSERHTRAAVSIADGLSRGLLTFAETVTAQTRVFTSATQH